MSVTIDHDVHRMTEMFNNTNNPSKGDGWHNNERMTGSNVYLMFIVKVK